MSEIPAEKQRHTHEDRLDPEHPVPEPPAPDGPVSESPVPGQPPPEATAPLSPEPEATDSGHPITELPGGRLSSAAWKIRARLGPIVVPLALGILGLALLVAGLILYPRRAEHPAPLTTKLVVFSTCPVFSIGYAVDPVPGRPGVSRLEVRLKLPEGLLPGSGQCVGGAGAGVTVVPPPGTVLMNCKACHGRLTASLPYRGDAATAYFFVKASNFGVDSNGVTAFAAIPEVLYVKSKGGPLLIAAYHVASASSFDWSADPPVSANRFGAIWEEAVAHGETAGRVAVGIDQTAQANDNFNSFLAGALLALAGAAILTAVVEAAHTRDWDAIRALRSNKAR